MMLWTALKNLSYWTILISSRLAYTDTNIQLEHKYMVSALHNFNSDPLPDGILSQK